MRHSGIVSDVSDVLTEGAVACISLLIFFVWFICRCCFFSLGGRMFVLSCKCWMSSVQPVAMHRAVFCIVCRFVMFVVDAIGDHIVKAYSSIGLAKALCAKSNVLCLPHLVEERTLSIAYWYSFGYCGCCVFNVIVVSE